VALPVIPGHFLVSYQSTIGESAVDNVFCIDGAPGDTAATVAGAVRNAWNSASSLQSIQTGNVKYQQAVVTPLDGTGLSSSLVLTPTQGLAAGNAIGVHTCFVYTLQTAFRGRSGRGRLYLGGLAASAVQSDGTRWSSSTVTSAAACMSNFLASLVAGSRALEVLSRKNASALPVVTTRANSYLGTQRRRSEREEKP
jgi:hypothetical protein